MLICLSFPAFLLWDGKCAAMMKFSDKKLYLHEILLLCALPSFFPPFDWHTKKLFLCMHSCFFYTFFLCVFSAIQSFSLYTFSCALNRRIHCPFGRKVFSLPYDLRWSEMCSSLSLKIWSTCRERTAFTFPILYHCDLARPLHQMNKGTHLIFLQALFAIFF